MTDDLFRSTGKPDRSPSRTGETGHGLREGNLQRVIIDTTVQEKAIAYSTDNRLIERAREHLVKAVEEAGIPPRQNYNRVAPSLARQAGRYAHVRQYKRMRRTIKKQRTLTGRIVRDIERRIDQQAELKNRYTVLLTRVKRILAQQPKDKNKLYALHAPGVECTSKGKARQHYEFRVKVGITVTHRHVLIFGARSFPAILTMATPWPSTKSRSQFSPRRNR